MAKKQVVQFIDDLDGKLLDDFVTIRWSLDDKQYEFDTSPQHADQFYKVLDKYLAVSRRTPNRQGHNGSSNEIRPKDQVAIIREWARENGYEVNSRGRVPASIVEAFDDAH